MAISPSLLPGTDMPMTTIGQPVEYRGTSAFSRAFRAGTRSNPAGSNALNFVIPARRSTAETGHLGDEDFSIFKNFVPSNLTLQLCGEQARNDMSIHGRVSIHRAIDASVI